MGKSLNGTRWTLGDKGRFLEGSCEFLGTGVMVNENQLGKCLHGLPEAEKTCGWKSEKIKHCAGRGTKASARQAHHGDRRGRLKRKAT